MSLRYFSVEGAHSLYKIVDTYKNKFFQKEKYTILRILKNIF